MLNYYALNFSHCGLRISYSDCYCDTSDLTEAVMRICHIERMYLFYITTLAHNANISCASMATSKGNDVTKLRCNIYFKNIYIKRSHALIDRLLSK